MGAGTRVWSLTDGSLLIKRTVIAVVWIRWVMRKTENLTWNLKSPRMI